MNDPPVDYEEKNMEKEDNTEKRLKGRSLRFVLSIILVIVLIAASIAISLMYPQVRTTLANLNSDVTDITNAVEK